MCMQGQAKLHVARIQVNSNGAAPLVRDKL